MTAQFPSVADMTDAELASHPVPLGRFGEHSEEGGAVISERVRRPRQKREKTPPPPTREQIAAEIAATLPADPVDQLAAARECIETFDASVRAGDSEGWQAAMTRYDAVIFKLNRGCFFASYGGHTAPGYRLARYCAAVPGTVPMWGQCGEYLETVSGMRVFVRVNVGGFSLYGAISTEFRIVDVARPFLSPTGYRSHFQRPVPGVSFQGAVRKAIAFHMAGNRPLPRLAEQDRVRRAADFPAWLNDVLAAEAERFQPGRQIEAQRRRDANMVWEPVTIIAVYDGGCIVRFANGDEVPRSLHTLRPRHSSDARS